MIRTTCLPGLPYLSLLYNAKLPNGNERPYHFAVFLNPYDMDGGAYVTTMYKRPYTPGYTPPVANLNGIGPGDDAACFIGGLTQAIPALVPTSRDSLPAGL